MTKSTIFCNRYCQYRDCVSTGYAPHPPLPLALHDGGTCVTWRPLVSHDGGNCRVESSQVKSHHMATSRIMAETVESSRVESSHITWRPLASWRKLSSRGESHHITWRPLALHDGGNFRVEAHHITWRPTYKYLYAQICT